MRTTLMFIVAAAAATSVGAAEPAHYQVRHAGDLVRLCDAQPAEADHATAIAFCHGVSPNGAVLRRAGRYAEALVVFEEPSLAYRLGFALGVQLFVERAGGEVLFQQRGRSIGRDPLLWTASASGGLQPGEDPRFAILADAAEEGRKVVLSMLVVGLVIAARDLAPWTPVKLRNGPEEWVESTLSKWAAGLNPSLRVAARTEVIVMIAGAAQSVSLLVEREEEAVPCDP